ncbi:DUF2931 family protein [Flavobacterium sp. ALJ2]|uniref:DUF2931 family protein n=1 Tax=Flavobacterium sp. ALJ2 TaxID=2786960 RepID=UPI001E41A6DD|nr:DUF2931 family protein [Flavobacterium sp. ALJ2]
MKKKEYSWTAAASTPENYPAEIFSGHLLISLKPNSYYAYLPFNAIINPKQGLGSNNNFTMDGATAIAPKVLDITWMSYVENKSYSGIFNLDADKIQALMINGDREPFYDTKLKKIIVNKYYDYEINVGLIPGGIILVWVGGSENTTLVGRYQAHEDKNVNWMLAREQMTNNSEMDEDVADVVSRLPQEIKDQITQGKIPFGYWDTLLKQYNLIPAVKPGYKVETLYFNYVNGEFESIFLSLDNNVMPIRKRAAPRKMNIVWHDINDRRMESDVYFDEKKIKALFEQTKPNEPIQFVIEIDRNTKPRETTGISIKLKTNDREIGLQEAIVSQETFTKSKPY